MRLAGVYSLLPNGSPILPLMVFPSRLKHSLSIELSDGSSLRFSSGDSNETLNYFIVVAPAVQRRRVTSSGNSFLVSVVWEIS